MIKAVIFDMDGVIIDSEPIYQKWLKDFLNNNQIEVSAEELKTIPGISTQAFKNKIEEWWRNSGKSFISGEELNKMYDNFCDPLIISYKKIKNPFLFETMEELKLNGYKIAIASSSPLKNIKEVIKEIGIDGYIDVKISGEMFKLSKPNPEIYCYTAKMLGLNNNQCIAVEDSTYGIEAAVNAGMKVIAKKDDRYGFDQSKATYHIDDLFEIINIVNSI